MKLFKKEKEKEIKYKGSLTYRNFLRLFNYVRDKEPKAFTKSHFISALNRASNKRELPELSLLLYLGIVKRKVNNRNIKEYHYNKDFESFYSGVLKKWK